MIMNGDRVDAMDSSRDGGMCCNRLLWLCILCFWFVLTQWSWMRTDHTRPDPSALILSVKFCDQETGTNLHTKERNERFSTLQLLTSSVWRHLSPSCFCHLLVGAKSIITRAGTHAHVHFVTMSGDPRADQRAQKTWPHTSTLSTIPPS